MSTADILISSNFSSLNYPQVAGLSLMDKSLNELYDTYIRTRLAVNEAMPDAQALIGLQQVQLRIVKFAVDSVTKRNLNCLLMQFISLFHIHHPVQSRI